MGEQFGDTDNWLALKWFKRATFENFQWENEMYFYSLLAIPIIFLIRWLIYLKSNQRLYIALSRKDIKWSPYALLRFIPGIVISLAIALLIIALARPQKTNEKVEQWTEGIDIMLVIDISESMKIEDFKPNRLESAKNVARNFIELD
jgi:Ca-activated chloride channel homolog